MTRIPTTRLSPATSATSTDTGDDNPWTGAACLKEDPELFFPDGDAGAKFQVATAKSVCRRCDLRPACLDGALERREPCGVWGGELFIAGKILADKPRRPHRRTAA